MVKRKKNERGIKKYITSCLYVTFNVRIIINGDINKAIGRKPSLFPE